MKSIFAYGLLALPTLIAAANPTITIGPASNYEQSPASTVAPTKSELQIVPTSIGKDIPKDGINVFFGPDLQKALSDTLSGSCGSSQQCATKLIAVLDSNYALTIQSRAIGLLATVGASFVVGLAMIIQQLHAAQPAQLKVPDYVHVPASDLAQLHSVGTGPVVFETKAGSPLITVTPTATPTPTPGSASVTIVSANQDGHVKGDVIVTLPTQQADILDQLIHQTGIKGKCKTSARRRSGTGVRIDYGPINNAALFILPMAAPGQLLADLGLSLQQLPQLLLNLRDATAQAFLEYVQGQAGSLAEFAKVSSDQIKAMAELVWKATYDSCVDNVDQLTEIVLDNSLFLEDPHDGNDDENDQTCSKDIKNRPSCDSVECAAVDGVCQSTKLKGCACLPTAKVYWSAISQRDMDDGQKIIKEMLGVGDGPGKLECDADKRVNLEYADYLKLSSTFCKNVDLKQEKKDISITPADAGARGTYPGTDFSFSWTPKDGSCSSNCADIFAMFNASTVCSYDSHTMAASGSQELACGTASFDFGDAKSQSDKLTCGTETDMGNANHFVAVNTMNQAAHFFCQQQVNAKTRFESRKVSKEYSHKELHYNNNVNDPVYLSIDWQDGANCPVADFGADGFLDVCVARLAKVIHSCDTSNPRGFNYWKQGGSLLRDCVNWTIKRDKFNSDPPNTNDSWRPKTVSCAKDLDCNTYCRYSSGKGVCTTQPDFSDQGWCSCK